MQRKITSKKYFLISAVSLALTVTSFSIGMEVFMARNASIQLRKEQEKTETIYLSEVMHANKAAKWGTIIAGAFLLTSIGSFAKGIGTWHSQRNEQHNQAG